MISWHDFFFFFFPQTLFFCGLEFSDKYSTRHIAQDGWQKKSLKTKTLNGTALKGRRPSACHVILNIHTHNLFALL